MAYARAAGAEPELASAVSPLTQVAATVAAGAGIGLVTASLAAVAVPGVTFLRLAEPALPVAVAWRAGVPSDLVGPFAALCLSQTGRP